MKRLSNIFAVAAVGLMLTGCGLYDKYQPQAVAPTGVFGAGVEATAAADSSMAPMSWREFFTDPHLQNLIEQVLANNTDLNSARIAVEKSEAALKAAKLAYLPSLYFAPQGSLAKFDKSPWSKTYNLPLQLSIDVDVFGSITNQKRASQAVLLQAQIGEEAVRTNLVSLVAQQYYMLQLLDRQLDILNMTDSLWNASLETQKSLWENGKSFSTAVNQMEASFLDVKTQIVDTRRNIRATENALCRLLAVAPQRIERSSLAPGSSSKGEGSLFLRGVSQADSQFVPLALRNGIRGEALLHRPDIRMANHAMEEAFYNTQAARAAFFPTITLSATAGWTNSAGGAVIDPGKLLLNFVGQLTQPILARGKLKANLKINQLTQEDLKKKYVQTVIDAGNQVNEAMADCEAAREKYAYYHRQVEVLHEAYTGTHELMDNGKASYLEVLTAQESLLNAQLSEVANMYNGTQALIALYIALGGGAK
ncbi:MAG: TolC family protein [Prevotella sp.]|nr:TolC family protein [Prevotella sp.]